MKRISKICAIIICLITVFNICAFAGSGYGYDSGALEEFDKKWDEIQESDFPISVTPGDKAGEINFSWISSLKDFEPMFKSGTKKDLSDATFFEVNRKITLYGKYYNYLTVSGLKEGKTYFYSFRREGLWSDIYEIKVPDSKEYTALFVSDSQIGRSGDEKEREVLVRDTCGWNDTVNKALNRYGDAAFMISAGDQLETAVSLVQLKAYLYPEKLRSIPVANAVGNHDFYFPLYSYYTNNPNKVNGNFKMPAGSGYFYSYGDALFIVFDSNDMMPTDISKLLKAATDKYPDKKWRIAVMHHSLYSVELEEDEFYFPRAMFSPLFDAYDIDLCLSGHDHIYSRTKTMYAGEIAKGEGTVYIQASSASGSNFDNVGEEHASYTEAVFDTNVPTYTALNISNKEINVTTYRTDTDDVVDTCTVTDNLTNSKKNIFDILKAYINIFVSMI